MAQDLMKTISALRERAVGNYRKRLEAAALKEGGPAGNGTPDKDQDRACGQPPCGVTSVLKRKYGL